LDALQMAVLVQQLLPARYAFVSHTLNPISGTSPFVAFRLALSSIHCSLYVPGCCAAHLDCWRAAPTTLLTCVGSDAEVYIELVQGLGETLVGNYPGTALRCVAAKTALPEASGAEAPRADAFPDEALK